MNIYTCTECAKSFKTERSLRSHKNWHKPDYAKKAGDGARSSQQRATQASVALANLNKETNIEKYMISPQKCKECNITIEYEQRENIFCSRKCSGVYTNKHLITDEGRSQQAASLIVTLSNRKIYNYPKTPKEIKVCVICNTRHIRQGKTCSSKCMASHVSNVVRGKNGGNRDCNLPGIDSFGKHFYFDSNWEILLSKSFDENGIKWARPDKFLLSNGRSYTPDFYLPEYNVYIDPKAKRPNYYRKSILKIELFESEFNTRCLVITDKRLLQWYHVQTMLLVDNHRS